MITLIPARYGQLTRKQMVSTKIISIYYFFVNGF